MRPAKAEDSAAPNSSHESARFGKPVERALVGRLEHGDDIGEAELREPRERLCQLLHRARERVTLLGRHVRVGDIHSDRLSKRGGVATFMFESRLQPSEPLAKTFVRLREPGGVPGIRVASREPKHARAVAGYE